MQLPVCLASFLAFSLVNEIWGAVDENMVVLSNNSRIPLLGVGVGNSPHAYVGALVAESIRQDGVHKILIDTTHASFNEGLVAEGILAGAEKLSEQDGKLEVHVVTKVWYTHLGYGRTKLSVEESLKALDPAMKSNKVDLKVHVQLHWPRCYDRISWTDCAGEEAALATAVKQAGPNPAQDPENAWKESWKVLEDIYLSKEHPIESIGVSNFQLDDIEKFDKFARIQPHILQVNLWSLMHDSLVVDYCHKHGIHMQVYNALQGTLSQADRAPKAYGQLEDVAAELGKKLTPVQIILAWLIQNGISVSPRTSRLGHLRENAATAMADIPPMSREQVERVAHAVEALMAGRDHIDLLPSSEKPSTSTNRSLLVLALSVAVAIVSLAGLIRSSVVLGYYSDKKTSTTRPFRPLQILRSVVPWRSTPVLEKAAGGRGRKHRRHKKGSRGRSSKGVLLKEHPL